VRCTFIKSSLIEFNAEDIVDSCTQAGTVFIRMTVVSPKLFLNSVVPMKLETGEVVLDKKMQVQEFRSAMKPNY
jgi:hypothetical protein